MLRKTKRACNRVVPIFQKRATSEFRATHPVGLGRRGEGGEVLIAGAPPPLAFLLLFYTEEQ